MEIFGAIEYWSNQEKKRACLISSLSGMLPTSPVVCTKPDSLNNSDGLMLSYSTLTISTPDTPSQRTSMLPTVILQGLAACSVWHSKCQCLGQDIADGKKCQLGAVAVDCGPNSVGSNIRLIATKP